MGCSYDRDKAHKKNPMCSSHSLVVAVIIFMKNKTEWKKNQDNDSL